MKGSAAIMKLLVQCWAPRYVRQTTTDERSVCARKQNIGVSLGAILVCGGLVFPCGCTGGSDDDEDSQTQKPDIISSDVSDVGANGDGAPDSENAAADVDSGTFFPPECTTTEQCSKMEVAPPICETWVCDTLSGRCKLTAIANGSQCDDNNVCTESSACSGGICVPTGTPRDCTDSNPCTVDACDKLTGCNHTPKSGGQCDDGNECTSGEVCAEGVCSNGQDICPAQCGNRFCQVTKGESCSTCPEDCGPCPSGCSASVGPGCGGCACEACVCAKKPECCTIEWTDQCVGLCTGTCEQTCDGCGTSPLPTCGSCSCEACVCTKVPSCCTDGWSALCVAACEVECGMSCQ
ncbi:MAG: hypothetical protein HUU55_19665 [Myxococcales bacterium]|nr:hypothetical protein [Myxococcales bacterium]